MPRLAWVSLCGLGVSEVGVLGESRNSLLPQIVETSSFYCFKSCRELKIEAFLEGGEGPLGALCLLWFLSPSLECSKNPEKSARQESALQRNQTPKVKGEELFLGSGFIIISVYSRKETAPLLNSAHVVFS